MLPSCHAANFTERNTFVFKCVQYFILTKAKMDHYKTLQPVNVGSIIFNENMFKERHNLNLFV